MGVWQHAMNRACFEKGVPGWCWVMMTIALLCFVGGLAAAPIAHCKHLSEDLTELSLEDLMDIEITSVAKKSQRLSDAAAAVFAITGEDIRRSGVTSIAEALRMAPGVQVGRIDSNKWAISIRGFNGRFSNKLLVLMDGRTLYSPSFSGVFWDAQDTMLEDIERIEVIRGPGATLWGANAVNGVINIITKNSTDTQGGIVTAGAGTEEQGFGSVRYGGNIKANTTWRAYAKYFNRDDGETATGKDGSDEWDVLRGGFRMDHGDEDSKHRFTVQGDIYNGQVGERVTTYSRSAPYAATNDVKNDQQGGHILGRWEKSLPGGSDIALQCYYDRFDYSADYLGVTVDTYDIEFQHRFTWGDRQEIIWGIGYRFMHDDYDNSEYISFDPDTQDYDILSAFVQDEITVIPETLNFTVGLKFEHNDFSHSELQPSARFIWKPQEGHRLWSSIAYAVRTPSRGDTAAQLLQSAGPLTTSPPLTSFAVLANGSPEFDSEQLIAYEAGYRVKVRDDFSLDLAAFVNNYNDLFTSKLTTFPDLARLQFVTSTIADNKMDGEAYGGEIVANWKPLDWLSLYAVYSYLQIQLHLEQDGTQAATAENAEGDSPHNQVSLRASMNLPKNLELDLWGRYVDSLPGQNIDHYTTLDVRLAWKASRQWEFSVVGQNLLDGTHSEFPPQYLDTEGTEVERSVYGKVVWHF